MSRDELTVDSRQFELVGFLEDLNKFSQETFGPHQRTEGVIDHIRKELDEISESPDELFEWADLIMLAFDGALRRGFNPKQISWALDGKLLINEEREWPDWREADPGKAITHIKAKNAEGHPPAPPSKGEGSGYELKNEPELNENGNL